MEKIGIICNNYKVAKYEKELRAAGFNDFQVAPQPGPAQLTTIAVNVESAKASQPAIAKLCKKLETFFANRHKYN